MKYLALLPHETKTEWFGKNGFSMHGFFVVMLNNEATRQKLCGEYQMKAYESGDGKFMSFHFDLPCDDSKQDWHLTGTSFLKVSEFAKKLNPELTGE